MRSRGAGRGVDVPREQRNLLMTIAMAAFVPTVTGLGGFGLWLSHWSASADARMNAFADRLSDTVNNSFSKDAAEREFRRIDQRVERQDAELQRRMDDVVRRIDGNRYRPNESNLDLTGRRAMRSLERAIQHDATTAARALSPQ